MFLAHRCRKREGFGNVMILQSDYCMREWFINNHFDLTGCLQVGWGLVSDNLVWVPAGNADAQLISQWSKLK